MDKFGISLGGNNVSLPAFIADQFLENLGVLQFLDDQSCQNALQTDSAFNNGNYSLLFVFVFIFYVFHVCFCFKK